ncbi:MAG: hypothetical protein IJZ96_01505 [Lachnospiraceae bacterium]|nr:hypothetical protein [Lachnospiraceae bacterium]
MKKGTIGILGTLVGAVAAASITKSKTNKTVTQKNEKVDKFKGYYNMLNQWLCLKQEGKNLNEYFDNNGYKTVAIYGMGEMGNRLYDELKDTDIEVKFAIDKNAASTYSELTVFELEDELPTADVMVVTATFAFDEIEDELSDKVDMPIVSLDDVVYEI